MDDARGHADPGFSVTNFTFIQWILSAHSLGEAGRVAFTSHLTNEEMESLPINDFPMINRVKTQTQDL